jgi:hypothetical protein
MKSYHVSDKSKLNELYKSHEIGEHSIRLRLRRETGFADVVFDKAQVKHNTFAIKINAAAS